jgi:hypothetical protein
VRLRQSLRIKLSSFFDAELKFYSILPIGWGEQWFV